MLVPIYYFDDDGYFAYVGNAQKTSEGVLMPRNATQEAPDNQLIKTHFAKWNKDTKQWLYEEKPKTVEDFDGAHISHKSQTNHDREMRELIQKFTKECKTHRLVRGSEEEGLWWGVEKVPEKTQEEKQLDEANTEEQKALMYLRSTDYVASKLAEGVSTKEDYADVLQKRAEARERVNAMRVYKEELTLKIQKMKDKK